MFYLINYNTTTNNNDIDDGGGDDENYYAPLRLIYTSASH